MPSGRFPASCLAQDGTLYGAGGMGAQTQVVQWKPGSDRIESCYNLRDPDLAGGPARIYEMSVDNTGRLFLAENDNHDRSSYLWSARL